MEKLIFLHIPKSAGSTILPIFKRQYKRDSFFVPGNHPDLSAIKEKLASTSSLRLCFGHMDFGMHDVVGQPYKYATITLLDKCPIGWRFPPIDLIQPSLQFIE
jgi:hypothetical protein